MATRKGPEKGRSGGTDNLPDVWAILVSDVHLQAAPPVARAGERDWFEAMKKPLWEVYDLQEAYGGVPIIYAGDIFDRWNTGPEVINFALANLPRGYAIPGQHDLPNHNYSEIKRSAYWTLVEAGVLLNLDPGTTYGIAALDGVIELRGFPWGFKPEPVKAEEGRVRVAVVHSFIWQKGTGYPGAPETATVGAFRDALKGYDAAVFGDNHKGFIAKAGDCNVINCGGFMRRKIDEKEYRPSVGLLRADGSITRHYLDTTGEAFAALSAAEETTGTVFDMSAFVGALQGLGANDALDFSVALRRALDDNKVKGRVREIILQACEGRVK